MPFDSVSTDPAAAGLADLRDLEFLTIDPEGSLDLDQAMHFQRDPIRSGPALCDRGPPGFRDSGRGGGRGGAAPRPDAVRRRWTDSAAPAGAQ